MPGKKRFNSRFPPSRIKKIMQTDEDIGKVAAPVPIIISRALELFLEQILNKTSEVFRTRNAKTLSTSHIKHAVMSESHFDFLKDLVAGFADIPDTIETPKSDENGHAKRRGRRKGSQRKDVEKSDLTSTDSSDSTDEADADADASTPKRGLRDLMLPLCVNLEEDQPVGKDTDSVATLPVTIATPMASPNTMPMTSPNTMPMTSPNTMPMTSVTMADSIGSVNQVCADEHYDDNDDDDYDS